MKTLSKSYGHKGYRSIEPWKASSICRRPWINYKVADIADNNLSVKEGVSLKKNFSDVYQPAA